MIDTIRSLTLNEWTFVVAAVTLIIAVLGFGVTALAYRLKGGIHARGSFQVASAIHSTNRWVSGIEIENMKDRSLTVYSIYVRFGHNVYLELADFQNEPLTIKPFEVYKKSFQAPDAYTSSFRRFNLNDLISFQRRNTGKIFISTPLGRYHVKPRKTFWDPSFSTLKNPFTGVIQQNYGGINGRSFGNNCKFVAELKTENADTQYVGVYESDQTVKLLSNFKLSSTDIEDAESVRYAFLRAKTRGDAEFDEVIVHDYQKALNDSIPEYGKTPVQVKSQGWFYTHIIGRIAGLILERKIKGENSSRKAP